MPRYLFLGAVATAAVLFALSAAGSVSRAAPVKSPPVPGTVATFPSGTFAESLALDSAGTMYASVTDWASATGYVAEIAPDGTQTQLGPGFETGGCCLTGVAFDGRGRLYVADATLTDSPAPAVYRFDPPSTWTPVLTLPPDSFPNGLAFHGRWLYVSDSTAGAIWRSDPTVPTTGTTPWVQDTALLAPTGFGANGLAFAKDVLYVAVADTGSIVSIPIGKQGAAGTATVLAQDDRLVTADGISFDTQGNLYITVNGTQDLSVAPALWRMSAHGTLEQIDTPQLYYPTQPVFGTTPKTLHTLFVENGDAYELATPSIIALNTQTRGLTLPQ